MLQGETVDSTLLCVNPYEVNPLSDRAELPGSTIIADIPLKTETSASQRSQPVISSRGFYIPQKRIKLEMEEFGDLSPFMSQKQTCASSIDELNTPIISKEAFDFDLSNFQKNVHADLHVMLKYGTSFHQGGDMSTTTQQFQDDYSSNKDILFNTDRNITILPLENMQNKTDAIYSPDALGNGTYIEKLSPSTSTVFEFDMNNSVSVNIDSRNSSPYEQICPTSSERSYNPSPVHRISYPSSSQRLVTKSEDKGSYAMTQMDYRPKLSLNVNLSHQNSIFDVSTPNLIAEVVSLEDTGFNIIDFVNEDLPISDEVLGAPPYSQTHQLEKKLVNQPVKRLPVKRPRKRRSYDDEDDDDVDYVPPSEKSKDNRVGLKYVDTESDSEQEEVPVKRARGRPPKRTQSVSSDCSKDSDVSKYRVLRDKNNEASRKSRLKRKMKELEIEKEAEELHNKNIKLKAQVEELEKMVNNFRDNLFKIMINK